MAVTSATPVLLFVYRRVDLLPRVLDALEACDGFRDHPITVFSDGPRNESARDDVAAVRAYVRSRTRPNMHLVERPHNMGLAASIIEGVTNACAASDAAIVLEDDLVLAPGALKWFEAGLNAYRETPDVMQISGFCFDIPAIRRKGRAVFMPHPTSWGWAVWRRSWNHFDALCAGWQANLQDPRFLSRFEVGRSQRFVHMMENQMSGRSDSWAIRWHYSVIERRGLVLYPPETFVENIGRETGGATHGQRSAALMPFGRPWNRPILPALPETVAINKRLLNAYVRRLRWSLFGMAQFAAGVRDSWRRARTRMRLSLRNAKINQG